MKFFLIFLFFATSAHAQRFDDNPLRLLNELTPAQLASIVKTLKANPGAYDGLLAMGSCVEEKLTPSTRKALRSFGTSVRHNVGRHCRRGEIAQAEALAQQELERFAAGSEFQSVSECVKSDVDAKTMTQLLLSQMGISQNEAEEESICEAYGFEAP